MHEFDPTGHRHQSSDTVFPSTVLWIGDRNADEFESAFAITETFAAQIAYRPTIQSAVTRMASGVARIILTRSNRQALQQDRIKQLSSLYPNAEIVELLGPLCVGEAAKWTAPSEIRRIYPNQINDFLAQWLAADSPAATSRTTRYSVAVIAQTLAAAEPLMDLATDAGASVVWCRQSDTYRVRNVDVVWWDDSATEGTDNSSASVWNERLANMAYRSGRGDQKHAWIVSMPNLQQCRAAMDAGVDRIQTKPSQIEGLRAMITQDADSQASEPHQSATSNRTRETEIRKSSNVISNMAQRRAA